MIQRACIVCGALGDESRCPAHRLAPRASAARRGYDHKWRRTRRRFLDENFRCGRCGELATEVHHIDLQGPLGPRGHDPANLMALCASCHGSVHGGWKGEP